MNLKRITAFLTISLIWGSGWLVQQILPTPEDQLRFSALVYGLSAVLLGVIGASLRLPFPKIKECGYNAILGVTLVSLPYLLSFWAAAHVSSGVAFIVISITPLVATFLLDAPWSARNAAIAGVAGIVLVVADTTSTSSTQLGGILILFVGAVAVAGSLVFASKHLLQSHPIFMASIQLAVAAAITAIVPRIVDFSGPGQIATVHGNLPWMPVVYVCAGNSLAYALYYWLLRQIRPDQLASIVWLQFLVSTAEGAFLLRAHFQLQMLAGILVVAGSLVALARSKTENKMLTVGVTLRPR